MPLLPPNQQGQSTEGNTNTNVNKSKQQQQQLFYGLLFGTTRVSQY